MRVVLAIFFLKTWLVADLIGDICEHDDDVDVALEDHLPEVRHRLREGTLTSDVEPLLAADGRRHVAGVDVPALVLLKWVTSQWSELNKRDQQGITIKQIYLKNVVLFDSFVSHLQRRK